MRISTAVGISLWGFLLAYSFKHGDMVIPAIFCFTVLAMIAIALYDLGWIAKFMRWFKSN